MPEITALQPLHLHGIALASRAMPAQEKLLDAYQTLQALVSCFIGNPKPSLADHRIDTVTVVEEGP
jgi:hypothetical protein